MSSAALLVALASAWFGAEVGAGVRRSRPIVVLRLCWPLLAFSGLWLLSRFGSATNDQGGDITEQLVIQALAFVQALVYCIAAFGGWLYRLARRRRGGEILE